MRGTTIESAKATGCAAFEINAGWRRLREAHDVSALNPYRPPRSLGTEHAPLRSRRHYFLIYASVFTASYAVVVGVVAGGAIIHRVALLSPFQRFEYGLQLVDGAAIAILATTPIWFLAHYYQNATARFLGASLAAAVAYLTLFVAGVPTAFTWAVHGVPLGGARPFWPITGSLLLCSGSALCIALPIVAGHQMFGRQST